MNDLNKINPLIAKSIILKLGESGTPPDYGIRFFTVGLESYSKVLEEEYLAGIIKAGLSAFKLVIGSYGGG